MFWESIPNWFWGIYYLFLLSILIIGFRSFIKDKNKTSSIISIIFAITIPLLGIVKSIERTKGLNELEYLLIKLQKGSFLAIYSVIWYLYLLIWLILFLVKSRKIELINKTSVLKNE